MKTKGIKLSFPHFNRQAVAGKESNWYKVEQMNDSIDYHPGQLIQKDLVESLCANSSWKVTIVPVKN